MQGMNNHINYIAATEHIYSFSGKPVSLICPVYIHQGKCSFNIGVRARNEKEKRCYFKQLGMAVLRYSPTESIVMDTSVYRGFPLRWLFTLQ